VAQESRRAVVCHRQGKARGLTPHEVGALELRASYD